MRILLASLIVLSFISCNNKDDDNDVSVMNDSISMGAGYANDIYYSLKNGVVGTAPRNNWELGFKTTARSSSIIINSTSGVKLWQYPNGDTTAWNTTLDTTGMKAWPSLLDSDTTWSYSAFEANQTGVPNYGWGEYNMITHDVIGIDLFVIQLMDKSFKKIWIRKRAVSHTYTFSYANLDGTSPVNATVVCDDYATKNFVYYKLSGTAGIVDREPAQADWDLVLTRYYENVPDPSGQSYTPYPVTGILQNEGVTASEVAGDVSSNNYSSAPFSTAFSVIGSDWKVFNQQTNVYAMKPDTKYFVQTSSKNIYKLVFKKFEGSATGKVVFEKTKLK